MREGFTKSTLCQMKAISVDLCDLCGVREDVLHILETCQKFSAERVEWKSVCRECGSDELTCRMADKHSRYLCEFVMKSKIEL